MKGVSTKLRFGVSYCPYAKSGDVDMAVWDRDFKTMKELNFNAMRCFVAWDRIETEEGKFDFSKVDYVFELAEKHGIEVILNVGGVFATYGGIYPPRWLLRDYHCQELVKDPQQPGVSFGPYKMLCTDDEVYRSKAEAFTVRMVKRYAERPELFGWNVWNEAFLAPQCYCPLTVAKFRAWLRAKYKNDLDALNRVWGTEFPVDYQAWEEVEPGLTTGFLASGYVARLDWLHFNQERVAAWLEGVSGLVHTHDKLKRPATSNIVNSAVYCADNHGTPDLWSQARGLDITGFSFYTDAALRFTAALSSVRGSSNDPAKGFWVLETEAGQKYSPAHYPPEVADGPRREATHWLSVLHGAKTILLWKFGGRVTDTQTNTYNLTAWDGSITERARLNAKVAATFLANEKLFLERVYSAEVAILHSSDNTLFAQVDKRLDDWQNARFGASRLFRDLHLQADCVGDEQIRQGVLAKYKLLVLPHALSMDKPLADAIAQFVRGGGAVVADQRLAVFDENAVNLLRAPGQGLKELFGAYLNDYLLGAEAMEISLSDGGKLVVNGKLRSILHLQDENCAALGRWPDGTAAIMANKAGEGHVLWFGFQAFRDYEAKPDAAFRDFVGAELAKLGIKSQYEVSGLAPADEVELGALTGDDGAQTHFLINLSGKDMAFKLGVKGAAGLRDVLSDASYDFSGGALDVSLPGWGVKILA